MICKIAMPVCIVFLVRQFSIKYLIMKKILILACVGTLLCLASCDSKKEEKQEQVTFLVTSPLKKDTVVLANYVCQIRAIQHIELRALEKGYLEKIYVDEGKYVKQGQLMFQIMPAMYNAEFNKAEAEANFAEREYLNTKSLADSNIVSKNELALAKAKLNKAKAEMAIAQVHLGFTSIKAPFSGIMDHFQVRLGSLVNEGDLLTTMSDNSKMWVYFNVPEAQYLNIKTHQNKEDMLNVKLLMANNQMFKFPGIVQTVEADFNNETGNIAFRATFPNPEGLLRHGETGSIIITQPLKSALLIPQKATFEVLEKKFVYVVDKNNMIRSREIKIAAELPNIFAVQSGLKEGDKILLEGLRQVSENQKIQYKFLQPADVISHLSLYAE
jgi:membrane fusion protein, multidrug efflux system